MHDDSHDKVSALSEEKNRQYSLCERALGLSARSPRCAHAAGVRAQDLNLRPLAVGGEFQEPAGAEGPAEVADQDEGPLLSLGVVGVGFFMMRGILNLRQPEPGAWC